MINLMVGASGGGKSYEAVVFHVLPAMKAGRKVITNLPLLVDAIAVVFPQARHLIELRIKSKSGQGYPFNHITDYGDDWRHPKDGCGPLYIIDECHKVLRKGTVSNDIRNWFAEHRHERCDVLLITQSIGKVDQEVRENTQMVYRVRKATMLGKPESYVRHVDDGIKGANISEEIRDYMPVFFKFYKSHTKSEGGGNEAAVVDVVPGHLIWYRRAAIAGVVVFLLVGGMVVKAVKDWRNPGEPPAVAQKAKSPPPVAVSIAADKGSVASGKLQETRLQVEPAATEVAATQVTKAPFDGMGMHLTGWLKTKTRTIYSLVLSINGQVVRSLPISELEASGYKLEPLSECVARVTYGDQRPFFIRCDLPVQNIHTQLPGDKSART